MNIPKGNPVIVIGGIVTVAVGLAGTTAYAQNDQGAQRQAVIDYWTAERRAAAIPRDLRVDHRGLGYLR